MQEDMISQLTKSFMVGDANSTADAITFIEAPWGLNFHPTPAQAVVLKCFYGLPLDDKKKIVEVPDMLNTKILYRFTEKDFVKFLESLSFKDKLEEINITNNGALISKHITNLEKIGIK